jgi:hypothetical protein
VNLLTIFTLCTQMQGQTVKAGSKVVIHWNARFTNGMAYVMLGRSERLEDIFIAGNYDEKKIKCSPAAKLASEDLFQRALNNPANADSWHQNSGQLKVSLLNIRSLKAHLEDIVKDFVIMKSDIICLTETWMLPEEQEGFKLPGFNMYHVTGGRGKGVAVCVKEDITTADVKVASQSQFLQHLGIQLEDLSINVMYRSKECSKQCLEDRLETCMTSGRLLVVGDFNHPVTSSAYKSSIGKVNHDLQLTQHVKEPTHEAGNIIDLILANFEIPSENIFHHHPYYSDHNAICVVVPIADHYWSLKDEEPMEVDTSSDEDDQECQEKVHTAVTDTGAYLDSLLDF